MRRLLTTFILVFAAWLVLTFTLQPEEVAAGIIVSLGITFIARHLLSSETPRIILHPVRWMNFIIYLGMMLHAELMAHIDVGRAIITGRIRPAVVEVPVRFRSLLGKTLLGNSITLTPGTLTVEAQSEGSFFVHSLCYRKGDDIGARFHRYGLRVID